MGTATDWPVFGIGPAPPAVFVRFWDGLYEGFDEELYKKNIGQPLTAKLVAELFKWKNGSNLSKIKAASISRYHLDEERIAADATADELKAFLLKPGGVVWRVFLLHLQHHERFPIYDQHVHRAMAFLKGQERLEIPPQGPKKAQCYLESYRPFFAELEGLGRRKVDRALWAFGKFLNSEACLKLMSQARGGFPHQH